jgi:hypothetical protein
MRVALACSAPPLGRVRRTSELLAGERVRLFDPNGFPGNHCDGGADNELKPWQRKS